jgi:hypothetical protein
MHWVVLFAQRSACNHSDTGGDLFKTSEGCVVRRQERDAREVAQIRRRRVNDANPRTRGVVRRGHPRRRECSARWSRSCGLKEWTERSKRVFHELAWHAARSQESRWLAREK